MGSGTPSLHGYCGSKSRLESVSTQRFQLQGMQELWISATPAARVHISENFGRPLCWQLGLILYGKRLLKSTLSTFCLGELRVSGILHNTELVSEMIRYRWNVSCPFLYSYPQSLHSSELLLSLNVFQYLPELYSLLDS